MPKPEDNPKACTNCVSAEKYEFMGREVINCAAIPEGMNLEAQDYPFHLEVDSDFYCKFYKEKDDA